MEIRRIRGLQHFHLFMTALWGLMMPLSLLTGWVESVIFVSVISIYANFVGHFSSWQASRTEVRQAEDNS